jgi:hypothetical protein
MIRVALALIFLLAMPLRGFAQMPAWSVWQNQSASLLIVTTVDTTSGTFKGTFINGNKSFLCIGIPVPLSGMFDKNNNVTAVANFSPCNNTITVWKGIMNGKTLPTSWNLTYVDNTGAFQTMNGQDTFNQIN